MLNNGLQQLRCFVFAVFLGQFAPLFEGINQNVCIPDLAESFLGLLENAVQLCGGGMIRIKNRQQRQQLAAVYPRLMNIFVSEILQCVLAVITEVDVELDHRLFPLPGLAGLPVLR
ncbi:hypothetical protein D3C81_1654810 [compost metagenome]